MKMATLTTFVSLAIMAVLVELAMGANIIVGAPNGGWDLTTNLETWASSKKFSVGDNLIFQYSAVQHNVLEVTKAAYDSCTTSNPLQSHTGGNTDIPLSSHGKRYFICGVPGHCQAGMKLEVDTVASSSPAPTLPVIPPSPTPSIVPHSKAPSKSHSKSPSSKVSPSKSPSVAPTKSPSSFLSPVGSATPPSPSSANGGGLQVKVALGFAFGMMILLAI
ncbi:uclacyanin 1-like [Tasmannia lanceolata]|uniref:uclacyanin 1-like n=1 Tax=Tasmannia lanceolata TaxID=3420 RepID=UPI0040643BCC